VDSGVRLRLADGAAGADRFRTGRLRTRERDDVLRVVRTDGTLIGRVNAGPRREESTAQPGQ
jgi:hypothetical protein